MDRSNKSTSRLASFRYAFSGLGLLLREEPNSRIHLGFTVLVVFAGWFFEIQIFEWLAVILCVGLVICMEILNSVLERMADFMSPDRDDRIKKIKDLSAAAVLVTSIMALVVGLIIFLPRIIRLF
jgi:diacylglycerol kinase